MLGTSILWVEGEISSSFLLVKIYEYRGRPSSAIVCRGRWSPAPVAFTNIDGDEVNFCVTVLARLGGGHVNDLAGPALDHDVSEDTRKFVRETEAKSGLGTDRMFTRSS
jgi:hypothetical protein